MHCARALGRRRRRLRCSSTSAATLGAAGAVRGCHPRHGSLGLCLPVVACVGLLGPPASELLARWPIATLADCHTGSLPTSLHFSCCWPRGLYDRDADLQVPTSHSPRSTATATTNSSARRSGWLPDARQAWRRGGFEHVILCPEIRFGRLHTERVWPRFPLLYIMDTMEPNLKPSPKKIKGRRRGG